MEEGLGLELREVQEERTKVKEDAKPTMRPVDARPTQIKVDALLAGKGGGGGGAGSI